MTKPGKRAADEVKPNLNTASGLPEVGKGVLPNGIKPVSAADIKDSYIEKGAHCEKGGDQCFLDSGQRDRLISAYQQEVQAAQLAYTAALVELGLEKLIEKDAELPAIFTLVLDAIAGQAVSALGTAFKLLKGRPDRALADVGVFMRMHDDAEAEKQMNAIQMLRGLGQNEVTSVIKSGVDAAKKEAKSAASPGMSEDKQVTLSYIDELKEKSAFAFEHLRQDPPGSATDAQLVVLFHSFKAAMGHTIGHYKAALQEKIDRYKASAASKIGRKEHKEYGPKNPLQNDTVREMTAERRLRDLKVVWELHGNDPVPVLTYYKQDFKPMAAPLPEQREPGAELHEMDVIDDKFVPWKPVELEFVDTAVAKHKEIWGRDPEFKRVEKKSIGPLGKPYRLNPPEPEPTKKEPSKADEEAKEQNKMWWNRL